MPVPTNNESFAALLGKALQPPEAVNTEGRDLTDGFPLPVAPHHRVVDATKDPAAIEGAIAYDFTCRRAVFLIYRAYESCTRCVTAVGSGSVVLPPTGDYTCPHTQLPDYEAIINKTLSGEYLFGSENEVTQKDGSILISLKWFEKKLNQRRKTRAGALSTGGQKDEPSL